MMQYQEKFQSKNLLRPIIFIEYMIGVLSDAGIHGPKNGRSRTMAET